MVDTVPPLLLLWMEYLDETPNLFCDLVNLFVNLFLFRTEYHLNGSCWSSLGSCKESSGR